MDDAAQAALMERRKAYFDSLNLHSGMRFCPSDKELAGQLLRKIRRGDAVDDEDPIKEVDVYSAEPWDLWTTYSEDEAVDLYFYTKLKRKASKKTIIERGVAGGKGRWHEETAASEEVRIHYIRTEKKKKQQEVLYKFEIRKFSYWNAGHAEDRRWMMTEYGLKEEKGAAAADWVIFRLCRNRDGNLLASSSSDAVISGSPATGSSDDDDVDDSKNDAELQLPIGASGK